MKSAKNAGENNIFTEHTENIAATTADLEADIHRAIKVLDARIKGNVKAVNRALSA